MYRNPFLIDYSGKSDLILEEEYESIKTNLKHVLQSVDFCGICLKNSTNMFHVRELMKLDLPTSCSMEVMMNDLFGEMVMNNIPSKYVCDHCVHNIRQTYHFINRVKTTSLILNSYIEQMGSHIGEVESMLEPDGSNDFANTIIVLQNFIRAERNKDDEAKVLTSLDDKNSSDYDLSDSDSNELENEYLHFECKRCDETFKTRLSYIQHSKELHGEETACLECQKGQCVHKEYLKHIDYQIENGKKLLSCMDCDYACLKKESLIGHINKDHLQLFPYLCDSCDKSFHSLMAHQRHVKSYHEETLQCDHCLVKCTDSFSKKNHMSQCSARFVASCSICSKNFKSETGYKRHISLAHSESSEQKIKQTRTKGTATEPDKARACSICPAVLFSLTELKKHLNAHDPSEKHKCHVCKREFDTRKMYNGHINSFSHQLKTNPNLKDRFNFKCPHCDFTCKNNCQMENHLNTNHLKVKPHACNICNKRFTTSLNLRYHLERHKGIRQFQCSECSSMFTAASGLKKHCLRYHSDQRPIACDKCDKSFVCLSEFNLHKLRHHSEKSVSCPLCEGKFYSQANLRAHLKKTHMRGKSLEEFMKSEDVPEEFYEMMRDHRLLF